MNNQPGSGAFALVPIILGVILLGLTAVILLRPSDSRPFFGQSVDQPAPAFRLTDHRGAPFALEQLRGKLVLLTFGFTHCPNICPTTLGNLAAASRDLTPEEKARVQIVFVTLDPERDTVATLNEYVPFFDPGFIGLTGSNEEIAQVAKDYGVFFEKQFLPGDDAANSYTLDHSSYTYLIAPGGKWKLLYDYDEVAQPAELAKDVKRVLAESSGA